jgi:hypothetical protein
VIHTVIPVNSGLLIRHVAKQAQSAESDDHLQSSKQASVESTMNHLKKFEEELLSWANITVHPHRFGGREFLFGKAEVGHIHVGRVVDIPFTRSIHDALLSQGLAVEHRWVPNSGWITFRIRNEQDLDHALWLMRISYLRYALKTAADPQRLFERESEELHLNDQFKSLLEPFLPKSIKQVPADSLSA